MNKQKKEKIDYPNLTPLLELNYMLSLISRFIKWVKSKGHNKTNK